MNNSVIEGAIEVSSLLGLVECGKIPSEMMPYVLTICKTIQAKLKGNDTSAEQVLTFLAEKYNVTLPKE